MIDKKETKNLKKSIIMIGPLPPPNYGQSLAFLCLYNEVKKKNKFLFN